jgi:hypothetical protein
VTDNFDKNNLVDVGGFGMVYKRSSNWHLAPYASTSFNAETQGMRQRLRGENLEKIIYIASKQWQCRKWGSVLTTALSIYFLQRRTLHWNIYLHHAFFCTGAPRTAFLTTEMSIYS